MKAIIYARFSPRPKDSSQECGSNKTQIEYCREYCKQKGYEIESEHQDQYRSGDEADREGLWMALDSLKKGTVLVVYRRDRLARDVYLSEYIRKLVEKANSSIEAVSGDVIGDGPEQVMIRQVLAAVSEYEKKVIAIRTKYAMLRHQSNGRRMSRCCPYGYQANPIDESLMVEHKEEQETIKEIYEMRDQGKGLREIARELDMEGRPPRNSEEWNHKTIAKILARREKV